MTPFKTEVKSSALKFIRKQDEKTQKLIKAKVEKVAADPLDIHQSKWLGGHENLRSARVGAIRLIFEVDLKNRVLILTVADNRGQVYDRLG